MKAYSASTYASILGFRRDVDEIFALLGYYAVLCGKCLPTFRDNVSVPSSRVKSNKKGRQDVKAVIQVEVWVVTGNR